MAAQQEREKYPFPNIKAEQLDTIILKAEGAEVLIKCAEEIGRSLARPLKGRELTTNQIRAIFGEVRRIEGDWKINAQRAGRNLILLIPKMEYRARKEGGNVRNLVSVLSPAIAKVKGDEQNFNRFVEFFEAILAYHRAYGGS